MSNKLMRVEGLSELNHALTELPKALGKTTLGRALKRAGEPIADAAAAMAPRKTGRLAESMRVGTTISKRLRGRAPKESKVEAYVGPRGDKGPHYAIVQEFGSYKMRAHPYLRPAWDNGKAAALTSISKTLGEEIEKTRARIAAKAERRALQIASGK
jgi:HK97 gp10 family phage protein